MTISLIVAASENNVIGKDNQLLWRLPNDTRFFKNTTWGMPVIMGRKTFEALNGDPLPGRFNFVISRNANWDPGTPGMKKTTSLEEAIRDATATDCKEIFVIGGGQVYAQAMPIADKIYMTRVHAQLEGDAWFPVIDEKDWRMADKMDFPADDKHAYSYSFQIWTRKK